MLSITTLKLGSFDLNIFFKPCFTQKRTVTTPLHAHRYAEMHIVVSGKNNYFIANRQYTLSEGDALIIPPRTYHEVKPLTSEGYFISFQLDLSLPEVKTEKIPLPILEKCMEESFDKSPEKAIPYLYFFVSRLMVNELFTTRKNSDYAYLIYDFIESNYNRDIKLCDLSALLHISERQTQRIIKEETGNTFTDELTKYRMFMAEHLMKTTEMTMSEIAEYVGYGSYSGFWKAYGKYKKTDHPSYYREGNE